MTKTATTQTIQPIRLSCVFIHFDGTITASEHDNHSTIYEQLMLDRPPLKQVITYMVTFRMPEPETKA